MSTNIARASALCVWAVAVFAALPVVAQESAWNHKGSLMKLARSGDEVMIKFLDPKHTLLKQGVQRGTVLFQGTLAADNSLKGSAFAFRQGCDPAKYNVSGRFDPKSLLESFEIEGAPPAWPESGCDIKAGSPSVSSAKLVFTPYGNEEEPGEETQETANAEEASVELTAASETVFPREARSHGGAVRDGPAMTRSLVDTLNDGDNITIVEDTGQTMNGFNWYKVRYQGGKGYHWGGLICVEGKPLQGALDVCQ